MLQQLMPTGKFRVCGNLDYRVDTMNETQGSRRACLLAPGRRQVPHPILHDLHRLPRLSGNDKVAVTTALLHAQAERCPTAHVQLLWNFLRDVAPARRACEVHSCMPYD